MGRWCLDAGTGHTGAMVGSRWCRCWCNACWCTVLNRSGAMCPPPPAWHQEQDRRTGATGAGWGAGSTCTGWTSHLMVTMQLIVTRGLAFFLAAPNSEEVGLDQSSFLPPISLECQICPPAQYLLKADVLG